MIEISVVICTYNPNIDILNKVIDSLRIQTLQHETWELIIVDNNSKNNFEVGIDLSSIRNSIVLGEKKSGLTFARISGIKNAKGEIIIFVDDDNILDKDYLYNALEFARKNKTVGCFGGKSIPLYEVNPPEWFQLTGISLGCQNIGEVTIFSEYYKCNFQFKEYPNFAPIGTGMVIRKEAVKSYIEYIEASDGIITDRIGNSLSSGGDNEIVIFIIRAGWEIAYFPQLNITHFIPRKRLIFEYLCKMNKESYKSWVILCSKHGIGNYRKISKYTVLFRKIKAYIILGAFFSKLSYIKWKGACGVFEGLSNS